MPVNFFSQLAGSFRCPSIPSRNLQGAFDAPQFLLATCGKLSTAINSVSQHSEKLSTAVSGYFQVAGSRRLQSAAISARGREEGGRRRPRRGFQGAALLGLITSQGVCPPVSTPA